MRKNLLAAALAILMVLNLAAALGEASEAFSFNNTYSWGMTEAEIRDALGFVKVDADREFMQTYLELDDDVPFTFEDLFCEITFGLSEDKLGMIKLDFSDRVRDASVKDALVKLYGEGTEVTDLMELAELDTLFIWDEIDLDDDDLQIYTLWSLADGTAVLMMSEAYEDYEAKVVFWENKDK